MATAHPQMPEWTMGARMKDARRMRGLKITDMMAVFDVSEPTIRSWEQNLRQPRDLKRVLEKWAELTGVTAAWLLTGGAEYAVVTPRLRLLTAPKLSHSYERIPHGIEGRGPWMASTHIFSGARNEGSDPNTCGCCDQRLCA